MASGGIQQRLCHNGVVHFEMDALRALLRSDGPIDKCTSVARPEVLQSSRRFIDASAWHDDCSDKAMNMITRCAKSLAVMGSALAVLPLQAAPSLHDLSDIVATARATLTTTAPSATVEITPLDPRVRLPRCESALRASLPPMQSSQTSRIALRVQCDGPTPWNVAVTADVSTEIPVVVATRALRIGQPVSPADLEIVTRRIAGLGSCCATELGEVIGQTVRRPIGGGEPIRFEALETPPAIRRGELVTIVASNPGMEIRATGVALSDARSGEPVRIRHSSSLRIVQARADTPGVARVDR
jgi:flagella basal body P-ring formation protein FlgA